MKKTMLISMLGLILTAQAFAQYVDIPAIAVKDTAYVRDRITRTIVFNPKAYSATDLDIYAKVATGTDTPTVKIYPFKYKKIAGTTTWLTDTYADSVVCGTMNLTSTYKWFHFYIDDLFDNYPIVDGIVVVYDKNGSDTDNVTYYTNFRITP